MKLQELLSETDLGMTENEVKSFFLGALCAERPLSFNKALDELLLEAPSAREKLQGQLQELWSGLSKNLKAELAKIPRGEMEEMREQLDYFITAMSLSGTSADNCKDEELAEFIEEIESIIEDMEEDLKKDEADDLKEYLSEVWEEFVSSME